MKGKYAAKEKEIDYKLKVDLTTDQINQFQSYFNSYQEDGEAIKLEELPMLLTHSNVIIKESDQKNLLIFLTSKKVDSIDFAIYKGALTYLKDKGLLVQDDVTEDYVDAFLAMGASGRGGKIKKLRFKQVIEEFGFNINVDVSD